MSDLRQSLRALVDQPPVAAADIEQVAARAARYTRRRRALQGGVAGAFIAIASAAGVGIAQRTEDGAAVVASEPAGPPVSYTDGVGDTRPPDGRTVSPDFDIVEVGWRASDGGRYSVSMRVAGSASGEGQYVSYGNYSSRVDGEDCQAYYFLTPGTVAFAHVFCGRVDAGTRRLIARLEGTPVTATATADGGTVLEATFDAGEIVPLLHPKERSLRNLSAFTCDEGTEFPACGTLDGNADFATSVLVFRFLGRG